MIANQPLPSNIDPASDLGERDAILYLSDEMCLLMLSVSLLAVVCLVSSWITLVIV